MSGSVHGEGAPLAALTLTHRRFLLLLLLLVDTYIVIFSFPFWILVSYYITVPDLNFGKK
jgi:hypothetical protein